MAKDACMGYSCLISLNCSLIICRYFRIVLIATPRPTVHWQNVHVVVKQWCIIQIGHGSHCRDQSDKLDRLFVCFPQRNCSATSTDAAKGKTTKGALPKYRILLLILHTNTIF